MQGLGFRDKLEQEFEGRRSRNPRYSLRAFAAFLETDHSTLSQILRGSRRVPGRRIRAWGSKLGLSPEETTVYIAAEHVPDSAAARRQTQLRHWTAEALSIVTEPVHWEIVRLSRTPEFRADCRWIARQAGVDVDQVNLALSRLLRLGLLEAREHGAWKDTTGLRSLTERDFRRLALARVREKGRSAFGV